MADREAKCGVHFCEACGDCLHCFGCDPCVAAGSHVWPADDIIADAEDPHWPPEFLTRPVIRRKR